MFNNNNKYFSKLDIFNNYLKDFQNNFFNVISVNIRSISSIDKFNKFKSLIAQFEILPNIIAVQETWFQKDTSQIYNIPGYNAIHCCRYDGYGGISLFIKDTFTYTVEYCESKQFFEAIRISVKDFKINGKSLNVTSFYRSQKCELNIFYSFIEGLLHSTGGCPSIVVGDSNIDFLNTTMSSDISNILYNFGYRSCHYLITRPSSGKSIDNVFSNIPNEILVDSIECSISDHNLISCKVICNTRDLEYTTRYYRQCNYSMLRENVNNRLSVMQFSGNASDDTSNFINIFSNCVENATVEKEEKVLTKNLITPWINRNLYALISLKQKLLTVRRKKGTSISLEKKLKQISRVIKRATRICMNNYYQDHLKSFQQDPKKCWRFLNEQLGRVSRPKIQLKNDQGGIVTNSKQMCNIFNEYFLKVPKILKENISHLPGDCWNMLNTLTQYHNSFSFCNTNNEEILDIFGKLQTNKSPGPDGISAKMFLECKNIVLSNVVKCFNTTIETSTYPEVLKTCKIVPIPKGKMSCAVENFRPIALLPLLDKVFEKIMHKQLSSYLDENNLLFKLQFGFKKGSGTQEAVVNVVNTICEGLDNGFGGVAGVFYDFSKAFDLVDHSILLQKLKFYGIIGNAHKLIESYLLNRKQYVEIQKSRSGIGNIKFGVPQGSVLGPLLFTIYINDISNLKLHGKLIMYADDISLFYPYSHEVILRAHIEEDAKTISEFARVNRLVLNAEKTKLLRFRPCSVGNNNLFDVSVCGRRVEECSSFKYLGVHLQTNLSWNLHMQYLKAKIAPGIGMLYKFKNKFDEKTKLMIYNGLVHSHFNYLPIIYLHKKNTEFRSLQRSQNKALKIVYNLPQTFSTISLYKDVSKTILPIYGLYKLQLFMYMFKSIHRIGYNSITFSQNQTVFNTRNRSNLLVKRCRLETTKQRIEHNGCSEYNHLPQYLKDILQISTFKLALKTYLLENIDMLLL